MNTDTTNINRSLIEEAANLLNRAREAVKNAEQLTAESNTNTDNRRTQMESTTTLSAQRAGELYAAGQTVDQVAKGNGVTYAQAKKLIIASGTPIRDASSRLKGRTRKSA
jgi:DNA-nicking Smr family endonuclease